MGVMQLPMVPQLRDVKVPVMAVPPFQNKATVLSPLAASRTFVEVSAAGRVQCALHSATQSQQFPGTVSFTCLGQRRHGGMSIESHSCPQDAGARVSGTDRRA